MSKKFISKYHQYNKETQQKEARERYQNLSKEENGKKTAIWMWLLQKSLRKWKTEACWV